MASPVVGITAIRYIARERSGPKGHTHAMTVEITTSVTFTADELREAMAAGEDLYQKKQGLILDKIRQQQRADEARRQATQAELDLARFDAQYGSQLGLVRTWLGLGTPPRRSSGEPSGLLNPKQPPPHLAVDDGAG